MMYAWIAAIIIAALSSGYALYKLNYWYYKTLTPEDRAENRKEMWIW